MMKAVVKYQQGDGYVDLEDVQEPICSPGQAILEVESCGICGTDLHVYHDKFKNYPPVILGHEFSGRVVERGSQVSELELNDRFSVLGATAVTCGKCSYCYRGEFMFCKSRRGMGHGVNGAFTKYVAVRPDQCFSLPESVSSEEAALVEPFAAAVHAVSEIAKIRLGYTVLVSGPGPIGILCVKLLLAQGVRTIVAGTSEDKDRLEIVRNLGVARTVMVDKEDLPSVIATETRGGGVDIAFECAGVQGSVRNCLESLKPLGQLIQVGHFGKDIVLPWDMVAFKQLDVNGSVGYTRETWYQTIKIMEQGSVKIKDMITHQLPLSRWKHGFDLFEQKKGLKVLLLPEAD